MQSPKARRGRPTTQGVAGEKSTLSIRASAELKSKLDAASNQSGRSLSAEAEVRLEQSFRDQQRPLLAAMELAFGRELGGVLVAAGDAMARTRDFNPFPGSERGDAWLYDQMIRAAVMVLDAFRPSGAIEQPQVPYVALNDETATPRQLANANAVIDDARRLLSISHEAARNRLHQLTLEFPGYSDPARDLMGESYVERAKAYLRVQGLGWDRETE